MRTVFYIGLILILGACQEVIRPEKPENLLSKDKMVDILVESYIGNSARSIDNKTLRDSGVHLDSILFNKYTTDSLTFAQSHAYYSSQLNDYIDIMSKVENILNAKKKIIDSVIQEEAKVQRDTLDKKREERRALKDSTAATKLIEPAKD
jgi:glycine cleavage system protein P-like pyridoxal-binding family